ncbi:MAG: helix-turn-helix transcriptional regulator [Saprospiraceae bacterium]|nr:helix-turn-helix transcriptional regulator [Saprospiraceae bacterium]
MLFKRIEADRNLADLVREFWIVEDDQEHIVRQKIIPDGFCEIVIHYGDPYRINLHGPWEAQGRILLASQITGHFFLENTGRSGMLGIKLMPTTPFLWFAADMPALTDRVVDLAEIAPAAHQSLEALAHAGLSVTERVETAQRWVQRQRITLSDRVQRIAEVTRSIMAANGLIDIAGLARQHAMSRRHLEREFKAIIGVTPKFFARIQQFNYIFTCMQARDRSWIDVALKSGYFDQSHFIKNFKAFTGEQPSQYGFDEENMANFFLRPK